MHNEAIDVIRYNSDITFDIFWQEKLKYKDVVYIALAIHIKNLQKIQRLKFLI